MSTIVRMPDGMIKLFTKGADTVILERLSKNQPYTEKTMAHLEVTSLVSFSIATFADDSTIRTMPPRVSALFA